MRFFQTENRRLLASLWKAIGGDQLAIWWYDFRHDPLTTPLTAEALAAMDKDAIGEWGEELAAVFLRRQEYMKVLWRNFRAPKGGEVDVVCRHGESLVFIEVKTRTSTAFGRPIEAVDWDKQRLIARGALEWIRLLHRPGVSFRFDVVEIVLTANERPHITRVENAFELPDEYYLQS